MKKNICSICKPLFIFLCTFSWAFAVTKSDIENIDLLGSISKIINAVLGIVGGVAVLVLIIGGFQYITAAGNPDQVGKAKSTIMYAIVGLVICILSYVIVSFVVSSIK